MPRHHSLLLAAALAAVSTLGCATAGSQGPDLAYESLLGSWEMGDITTGFVTGRVTFLDNQRALVQCGTVVPVRASDPPREVVRRGRGWLFRGCEGGVLIRLDASGNFEARSDFTTSRASVGRGCEVTVVEATGTRCAQYGDNIQSQSRTDNRVIGFWRSGESPPKSGG
jgi:hypothetical protein